jgi:bifunctional DNA-binding transcriptional regulator/antitoxin component of YhaV-PrlF toxin-antitoxin module
MNAVEFSGKINRGQITIPDEYRAFDNSNVRVIMLFEEEHTMNEKKRNLKETLTKMKSNSMFSSIEEPTSWQKKMRDEWG